MVRFHHQQLERVNAAAGWGLGRDDFAALAAEDTNHDGRVDAMDARFAQLRVWRDLNQDGFSLSGELFTLQQLGIAAINVNGVPRGHTLPNGNHIADIGTDQRTHGTADVASNEPWAMAVAARTRGAAA